MRRANEPEAERRHSRDYRQRAKEPRGACSISKAGAFQAHVEALARDAADTAVPVFMKDSLGPIVGEENMLRELPWG